LRNMDAYGNLTRLGIPSRYHDASLVPFNDFYSAAYEEATRYVNDKESGKGFLLSGIQGSGKTWLGCGILKEQMKYNVQIKRCTMGGLVEIYTRDWHIPSILWQIEELFIDDFGLEPKTKANISEDIFRMLYKGRYERMLSTSIATSCGFKELSERYDKHTMLLLVKNSVKIKLPEQAVT